MILKVVIKVNFKVKLPFGRTLVCAHGALTNLSLLFDQCFNISFYAYRSTYIFIFIFIYIYIYIYI